MIERQIIIGCIVSTDYLRYLRKIWNPQYLESATAKRIARWCWEYFDKYERAPGKDLETIFYTKLKEDKLPKEIAEEIELEILPGLSNEFVEKEFNLEYVLFETRKYFNERRLSLFSEKIQLLVEKGELEEAEKVACEYKPILSESNTDLDFSNKDQVFDIIEQALESSSEDLINFPGALGRFFKGQLVRGRLVGFMGKEKVGKTYLLMEFAVMACKQGHKVAFFQAGDMTVDEQVLRFCTYLTKRSDEKQFCEAHWAPTKDCIFNQTNHCDRKEREYSPSYPFEGVTEKMIRMELTLPEYIKAYQENKGYRTCHNCPQYNTHHWGVPWLQPVEKTEPLTVKAAQEAWEKFFIDNSRSLKMATYPNDTLTLTQINATLSVWRKEDDFIPEIILIDYADILATEEKMDERAKQNYIWKGLRKLSESDCRPLVITVTQTDAESYEKSRLGRKNFSEDKRKFGHVSVMYGLNQDPKDREKLLGLIRINEIVKRKGMGSITNEVTVLQDLWCGRPFIGSYL